jgi:uncharacterized protein YqeY
MNIRDRLDQSFKAALRSNDQTQKRIIRLIRSSIQLEEVSKGRPLTDDEIISVIQKEVKIRQETAEGAQQAGRAETVQQATEEIGLLEEYLPKQLTDDELRQLAADTIQEVQAESMADMGKVMKNLLPRVQGKAANDRVSLTVRQMLTK